ncbi:MAG: PEP-CTERM sorting domain-containing protein [Deltaproteobacteria bacterium]|nr:PEP-CTERM sorting domain-containing protein [Candidatus Desulfobacula maris]MBL6995189.1 PEP-CTERM sorting domain-containing protein [Desulfobacula sp.]
MLRLVLLLALKVGFLLVTKPATMLFFGIGLLGISVMGRKKTDLI